MTCSLEFDARALKEWQKLGDTVRQQLKKKLAEVLLNPRVGQTDYVISLTVTRSSCAPVGIGWFIK